MSTSVVLFREDCRSMGCGGVKCVAANWCRSYAGGKKLNSAWVKELVTEANTPPYTADKPFSVSYALVSKSYEGKPLRMLCFYF